MHVMCFAYSFYVSAYSLDCMFFFFNDTATTEIYTLSLQRRSSDLLLFELVIPFAVLGWGLRFGRMWKWLVLCVIIIDRKSTRLNSSHLGISYAVFCLKKKKNNLSTCSLNT